MGKALEIVIPDVHIWFEEQNRLNGGPKSQKEKLNLRGKFSLRKRNLRSKLFFKGKIDLKSLFIGKTNEVFKKYNVN